MDSLIDIDIPSPSQATILRRRAPTRLDLRKSIIGGTLIGLAVGLGLSVILLPIVFIYSIDNSEFAWRDFWFISGIIVFTGIFIGSYIGRRDLYLENKNGILSIDFDRVEFWTKRGTVSIPMRKLFGAGPEWVGRREAMRFCHLEDIARGFKTYSHNFQAYEIVGGRTRSSTSESDGNVFARETILYYLERRRAANEPIAQLPEYAFTSTTSHLQYLVMGERVIDRSFSCDGKTFIYTTQRDDYRIPVNAVRHFSVVKVESEYGPTKWEITLALDLSCGYDSLKIDVLNMTQAQEVVYYCQCLPVIFPEQHSTF